MDTRVRIQTILLAEKMKHNKEFSEILGLKDCSHMNKRSRKRK